MTVAVSVGYVFIQLCASTTITMIRSTDATEHVLLGDFISGLSTTNSEQTTNLLERAGHVWGRQLWNFSTHG